MVRCGLRLRDLEGRCVYLAQKWIRLIWDDLRSSTTPKGTGLDFKTNHQTSAEMSLSHWGLESDDSWTRLAHRCHFNFGLGSSWGQIFRSVSVGLCIFCFFHIFSHVSPFYHVLICAPPLVFHVCSICDLMPISKSNRRNPFNSQEDGSSRVFRRKRGFPGLYLYINWFTWFKSSHH